MALTHTIRHMLQSIIIILLLVWLLLSMLLYVFQSNFVYYPHKTINMTPDMAGLDYREVNFVTSDGVTIHGWFVPHPEARGSLLFLHGNAGNISHRMDSLQRFHAQGLSVLIIDYRGYGQSEGQPSEQGTYHDARAAWEYLLREESLAPEKIVLFGRSLGGAVATWLATQTSPAGLIVESTFSSITDMGRHIYPFLPVKTLTRINYPTVDMIPSVNCPVLVIHSRDDDIVPFEQGRKIFLAANEPRHFLEIRGDHNYGFIESGALYTNGLADFLDSYLPANKDHR